MYSSNRRIQAFLCFSPNIKFVIYDNLNIPNNKTKQTKFYSPTKKRIMV